MILYFRRVSDLQLDWQFHGLKRLGVAGRTEGKSRYRKTVSRLYL